ncbi:MAG: nucleotidyltransferase family protein [Acidimicrobiia bacterium]|nr:nucleotidyltransferase family protein [Acidimicrobiia bacterium]
MAPDTELTLLAARTGIDNEADRRIRELVDATPDWATIQVTATRHQVLPLVASTLLGHYRGLLPKETADTLTQFTRAVAARNMLLTHELLTTLAAFDAADIPAIPYKGPSLAVAAYGSIHLRSFGDLDILVPRDDYLSAVQTLENLGYSPARPGKPTRSHYLGHTAAHAFVKGDIHIDLQWGTTMRKALSVPIEESLWNTDERVSLLGRPVRAIPPDTLFLYLSAHGARHHWDRLKWVCDIGELMRTHPGLDWSGILDEARRSGSLRTVHMATLLSHSLLSSPVPAWVLDAAGADTKAVQLTQLVIQQRFVSAAGPEYDRSEHLRFTLDTKERFVDQLRYMRGFLFQPRLEDYDWVDLPDRASFLYPALRPVRLTARAVGRRLGLSSDHDH